jgi:hypothetical protein
VAQHPVKWQEEEGIENTLLKKIIQYKDSVGNEENGYAVPDLNKTIINVTKEPSDAHKAKQQQQKNQNNNNINKTQGEIWEEISEKFMENILDMVNQNVHNALKKFQDTKIKEHEMTQKQIKELKETSTNIKVKQRKI